MDIVVVVPVPNAALRKYAEGMHADMVADEAYGGSPAPPVEQIEIELVEGWADEIKDYGAGVLAHIGKKPKASWSLRVEGP